MKREHHNRNAKRTDRCPLVTIITVAYNSEATIAQTVESVLNQTYPQIEYLVIDGQSGDRTVETARAYEAAFAAKGIRYVVTSEPDGGIYDAMNKGIRKASGLLIGMINSDDWYEPDAVKTAVRAYRSSAYDMFYADIRMIRRNGSTFIKRSRAGRSATSRHWNHPTMFVTKQAYQELGVYKNTGIYDDFDLFLRFLKADRKMAVVNKVLANFRYGGASSEKSLEKCWHRCMDRYRCYRENGYSRLYLAECIGMEAVKYLSG